MGLTRQDILRGPVFRYLIIFVVLIFCILLAPRIAMGNRFPLIVYGAIIAVSLFIIQIRWPFLGLIAVMLGAMFVPFSWQGGLNITQIGLIGIMGIWAVDRVFFRKGSFITDSRTTFPALAFIIISILSFFLGQFPWYSFANNAPIEAQFGGLLLYILSALAFLIVPFILNNLRKLELFTWVFIAFGALFVISRGLGLESIEYLFQNGFRSGSLFWTWFIAILAGQLLANRKLTLFWRGAIGFVLLVTLYVAIVKAYDWRSGWFPPLISLAVIGVVKYWNKVKYFAPLAIIPFVFIASASIGQEDWSWATRLEAWIIVLTIAQISPILGMGFANYYWYTPLFPLRGFYAHFNSHSQFVDLLAQTGILGLISFLWFFAEISLLDLKLIKKVPEGFAKGYLYGALGGIAGTLVAAYLVDWVLPFVYNIGMNGFRASILAWLFMGGIVSIEQIVRKSE